MDQYEILRQLGEGGMGVVYLADHRETGQRVAIKTLTSLDPERLRGMRQEVRALRRLDHPCVVKVLDDGLADGVPWYAMEFIEGHSLSDFLDSDQQNTAVGEKGVVSSALRPRTDLARALADTDASRTAAGHTPRTVLLNDNMPVTVSPMARTAPMTAPGPLISAHTMKALGWVGQIAGALAYMHGEGVVHCDIKPDNILIANDGRAMLVDFGLAARIGTRVEVGDAERAGLLSGSAFYISPERVQGRDFDARSDLYALGCVLYEVLTQRVPFYSDHTPQIFIQHLTGKPMLPSATGAAVPPVLESLVMALLAKKPKDRPGHASAVVECLRTFGASVEPAAPLPPARPYLYRSPMLGRAALIDELKQEFKRSTRGEGRAVFLGGASGVGKTCLGVELVRQSRSKRAEILVGGAVEGLDHKALHILRGVFRRIADRCTERGPSFAKKVIGERLGALAPFAPFFKGLPGLEDMPELPELAPMAARLRLFRSVVLTLEAFSESRPLVLVLDDLQWADELSLDCLRYLCFQGLSERKWLVLGMYRAEGASGRLNKLLAQHGVTIRKVEGLETSDVGAMMASMMGLDAVPEPLAVAVAQRAEGNPFFVGEILRLAVERDLLTMDTGGQWRLNHDPEALARLPLPESLQLLLTARLDSLGVEARATCEAIVMLGDAEHSVVAAVAQLSEEALDEALMALERRGIIEDAGAPSLRITHEKVRALIDRGLSEEKRRDMHRSAAQSLSRRRGVDVGALGFHWQGAGEPQKARVAYLKAAGEASESGALSEAEHYFEKVLQLFEAEGELVGIAARLRPAVRLKFVEQVLRQQDRLDEGSEQLERALEESRALGAVAEEAHALRLLGDLRNRKGYIKEAIEPLEAALSLYGRLREPGSRGSTLKTLANVFHQQGRYDEALATYADALELLRKAGDSGEAANVLHNLGLTSAAQGRYDQAMAYYQASLVDYRALEMRRGESFALNNIATLLRKLRRHQDALQAHREGLAIHRDIGNRLAEGMTLNNMAVVLRDLGEFEQAAELYVEALEIRREIGDDRRVVMTLNNLGNLRRCLNDWEGAMALYEEALALARKSGVERAAAQTLCNMGEVCESEGYWEAALAHYEESMALWQSLEIPVCVSNMLALMGRVGMKMGREVDEILGQALEIALEIGSLRQESVARLYLSRCHRGRSDLRGAVESLHKAQALFESQDDLAGRGLCLCERGHLSLMLGQDASGHLHQARTVAAGLFGLDRLELDDACDALEKEIAR